MNNIVALHGAAITQPGVADERVVKQLEELLDMAKSGVIGGVAVAFIYNDLAFNTNQCFAGAVSYGQVGRLSALQEMIIKELQE